jgi:alcohol dehydrogenase (cytochrome c)
MRIIAAGVLVAAACFGQVTWERILHAEREPQNWLTYSGSTQSQRYSALTEIRPDNLTNLN